MGPAMTPDDLSEDEKALGRQSGNSSMPGSFEERGVHFPEHMFARSEEREREMEEGRSEGRGAEREDDENDEEEDGREEGEGDSFDDGAIFDDDILATGEMRNVPF